MRILGRRILVEQVKEEEVTVSGIIIPNKQKKHPIGKIIQLGEKVQELKVGQKIMYYQHHQGVPISVEGKDYLLLTEDRDVITIL